MPAAAVLFDIDGTLAVSSSAHLTALADVATSVLGVPTEFAVENERPILNGSPVSGFVDAQCFRQVARSAGFTLDDELLAVLNGAYASRYVELLDSGAPAGVVLDGVPELLEDLAAVGIPVGLCTGNSHRIAREKLRRLGLAHHFRFAAHAGFGDVTLDRTALVPAAARALGVALHDRSAPVFVVGDTGRDMKAAYLNGAYGIGVTTGADPGGILVAAGAHAVVDHPTQVLDLVTNGAGALVAQLACWMCGLPGEDPCRDCGGTGLVGAIH